MALLHAQCFSGPERWSQGALAEALAARGAVFAHHAGGFALGRVMADEAELLTLAVPTDARRGGIGRLLLARFCDHAQTMGARQAFLEVAADNAAARGLYLSQGWHELGLRRAYYHNGADALTMARVFDGAAQDLTKK